ncbi:MAG: dihydroorotate dehydrogenase electron transfer subunit [Clostridia bacterium]|nr:dihydroorotate dehydrogenase electron transfer subunit [Clostridia bacterium]
MSAGVEHIGLICSNVEIGPGAYLMEISLPEVALRARPGQFLHLRCGEGMEWLLRRPLSVHDVDKKSGRVSLLYQVVGKGTSWLAGQKPGINIDVLGPLGRGFSLPPCGGKALLVAGGVGIAPLFFLARELLGRGVILKFFLGARTRNLLLRLEALQRLGIEIEVATDDGSAGFSGPVTALLEKSIPKEKPDIVFACGPRPMLAACAGLLAGHHIPGEFSLEERMACGLGACRGCAVPVRSPEGGATYENVCTCGPVFAAQEIIW